MWPKAFAQFIELAPHISRLLPMADRFFQSKNAADDSTRRAIETMAQDLHGELGQVTAGHAALFRQMSALAEGVTALGVDVQASKLASTAAQAGVSSLDARLDTRFAELDKRLAGMETRLERINDRAGGPGPVLLLLVLTNLILLACAIVLLVHRH